MPAVASVLRSGWEHSLSRIEPQWADAAQHKVVHGPWSEAERDARVELGDVRDLVSHHGRGALLRFQAIQDAAFIRALESAKAKAKEERALPIPEDWRKYKADLETIAKRFGAMSPDASDTAEVWLRNGVLPQSFQIGETKAITAKRLRGLNPYLQYVTRGDDKVRDNHAALDEFIAAAAWDGWVEECAPPCGYNCRCRTIPIPWQIAVRLGFSTVFPRGTSKLLAFRARGGADKGFPRDLYRLGAA